MTIEAHSAHEGSNGDINLTRVLHVLLAVIQLHSHAERDSGRQDAFSINP